MLPNIVIQTAVSGLPYTHSLWTKIWDSQLGLLWELAPLICCLYANASCAHAKCARLLLMHLTKGDLKETSPWPLVRFSLSLPQSRKVVDSVLWGGYPLSTLSLSKPPDWNYTKRRDEPRSCCTQCIRHNFLGSECLNTLINQMSVADLIEDATWPLPSSELLWTHSHAHSHSKHLMELTMLLNLGSWPFPFHTTALFDPSSATLSIYGLLFKIPI